MTDIMTHHKGSSADEGIFGQPPWRGTSDPSTHHIRLPWKVQIKDFERENCTRTVPKLEEQPPPSAVIVIGMQTEITTWNRRPVFRAGLVDGVQTEMKRPGVDILA